MRDTETLVRRYRSTEEGQMRDVMVAKLRELRPSARIIHELPLRYSQRSIDLAAVTGNEIITCEIKSSRDVIDRLAAQLAAFGPVSTRLLVALAPRWNEKLPDIERAGKLPGSTMIVPQYTEAQQVCRAAREQHPHIQIVTCCAETGSIEMDPWYYHGANRRPSTHAMLEMLHVRELVHLAMVHGFASRERHDDLVQACWSALTGEQILRGFCAALRSRDGFAKESDPPSATTFEVTDA